MFKPITVICALVLALPAAAALQDQPAVEQSKG